MKFKKLFMFICLIICLFTIASVCAGDVDDSAMGAIGSQDNLDINEDNQVNDKTDDLIGVDGSSNEPQDDNIETSAPENVKNSDNDKLGITDDDLIGDDLRANVTALNVTVADDTIFVVDCADDFKGNVSIKIGDNASLYDGCVKTLIKTPKLHAGNYIATALFYGDDNYGNLTLNDISFTVSRVTPTIEVSLPDVTYPRNAYANISIGNNANGTVKVTVNETIFYGTVSDGHVSVPIVNMPGGNMNVYIEFFSSDDYNNNVNASTKFVIYPNNSLIVISSKDVFYVGDDIEINIKTFNSTGDLTVYINGEMYVNKMFGGIDQEICVENKSEGAYIFTFHLDGDRNYTGYETSKTLNVIKKDLSINLTNVDEEIRVGRPVTFTAQLDQNVTGNVIFTINGANYTEYVDGKNVATHVYTPVNNNVLTVIATFEGNDKYKPKVSDSMEFNVTRIATTLDINFADSIISGDDGMFFVHMDPEITCTVGLIVGDKAYNMAIVDGNGMYTVNNLNIGNYDVEAVFYGDDKYANSTSGVKQLFVHGIPTNLNISIDKTSMSYHDYAVVSIELNQSINAVVTLKVNGNNNTVGLVSGKGTFTLHDLKKDNYVINAVFAGDDRYIQSVSNTLNLNVTGDNITSSLNISLNKYSAFVGDEVIVTAKFNSTVTGVITLNIGSDHYDVVVKKGVGTFAISDLANGTYDVWAVFDGDNKHNSSSSDVKQLEIKRIPTVWSVSVDNPSAFVGDDVIVTVNSNQGVSGVVSLKIGADPYNVVVNGGVGTFAISDLANGTYDVWAVFDGDDKYLGNSSDVKQLEVKRIPTVWSVSVDNPSAIVGDDVIVTVNSNQGVSGVVSLKIGADPYNVVVNGGVGTFAISDLANGTYDVWAVFDGDDKYLGNSSDVKQLEVKQVPTNLSVSIDKTSISVGDRAVVSVDLNQAINNVVTVKVNDNTYYVGIVNGKGNLTLIDLGYGTYTINAIFAGDEKYDECISNNEILTVNKIKTQLSGDTITAVYNENDNLVITLTDINGNLVRGVDVTVDLNGVKTFKTDNNGQVKVSTSSLVPKIYTAKITFKGNAVYDKSTKDIKVTVKKADPKIVASSKKFKLKVKTKRYTITLKDNVDKAIKNAEVTLKVKGKTYKATTNSNGKATFKIKNLNKKGTFKAVITYKGNNLYNKATANANIKV